MLSGPSYIPEVITSVVVLLHGFGSDGKDLISLAPYMAEALPNTAFYAPNGVSPTPAHMGYQWFSDKDWTFKDREGMDVAQREIEAYLENIWQTTGVKPEKTVLVGFSQGTMTALFVTPRLKEKLAGMVGLSGRMYWDEELAGTSYHHVPMRLIHGVDDEVVDPNSTPEGAKRLERLGFDVDYFMLPNLGHGIDEAALEKTTEAIQNYIK